MQKEGTQMDKRFQVFVSSTYVDLKEERRQVIQALLEMDCIPAGMELFPAADEEQLEFIKRVIDDCDYYLLIIGGKYGSLSAEGVSYTELEHDYAVENGLKVIALLHNDPNSLPGTRLDRDPEAQEKLERFRAKVSGGRLVKFWERADQLPGLAALSLQKTIKMYPATGWIRANQIDPYETKELLVQLNQLRQENEQLLKENQNLKEEVTVQGKKLASGEDSYIVKLVSSLKPREVQFSFKVTWNQMLSVLGPKLVQHVSEDKVNEVLATWILNNAEIPQSQQARHIVLRIEDVCFETIRIQFTALGYIDVQSFNSIRGPQLFWISTLHGQKALTRLRAVQADGATEGVT